MTVGIVFILITLVSKQMMQSVSAVDESGRQVDQMALLPVKSARIGSVLDVIRGIAEHVQL